MFQRRFLDDWEWTWNHEESSDDLLLHFDQPSIGTSVKIAIAGCCDSGLEPSLDDSQVNLGQTVGLVGSVDFYLDFGQTVFDWWGSVK